MFFDKRSNNPAFEADHRCVKLCHFSQHLFKRLQRVWSPRSCCR